MTCESFRQLIAGEVSFERLTTAERTALARHSFTCPACRVWHDDYGTKLHQEHGAPSTTEEERNRTIAASLLAKDLKDPEV